MKNICAAIAISLLTLHLVPSLAQAKTKGASSKVTGTYVLGEGRFQNRLRVSQLPNGHIWFFVNAYHEYTSMDGEKGANSGGAEGNVPLVGNKAEWKYEDGPGKLFFTFTPNSCTIKQVGADFDCGFGHNVDASGTYKKISAKVIPLKD